MRLPLIFLIFLVNLFQTTLNGHEEKYPGDIRISENKFTFSTYFDIDSSVAGHLGHVTKSKLNIRSVYQYFGEGGDDDLIATGAVRFLSLGQFFTWATVMDITDEDGDYAGTILGNIFTFAPSKFTFFDADSNKIGVAYMDNDRMGFIVLNAKENQILAKFKRIFVADVTDHWFLEVCDYNKIPLSFLILFGSMAVDFQGNFRKDN